MVTLTRLDISLVSSFLHGAISPSGPGPPIIELQRSHPDAHHILQDSSGRVISPTQIPVSDNKQNTQETSIHPAGFEPPIPAGEGPQTHVWDGAAKEIGERRLMPQNNSSILQFQYNTHTHTHTRTHTHTHTEFYDVNDWWRKKRRLEDKNHRVTCMSIYWVTFLVLRGTYATYIIGQSCIWAWRVTLS